MKKENIHIDISKTLKSLLAMARGYSLTPISNNCSFIISEIKNVSDNFHEQNKIRKIENDKKIPKSLNEIVVDLENLYPNLYDVNLCIYKADKTSTIIEIQYYTRSSLDIEYQNVSAAFETMLHCKVAIPLYSDDTKEKFDINWQLGTFNHKWKMFLWRYNPFKSTKVNPIKQSIEDEKKWKEVFEYPKYSEELWAAKFSHCVGCGDLRKYSFQDKNFQNWAHKLFQILHTPGLTEELREKLLSPEEIKQIKIEIENGF